MTRPLREPSVDPFPPLPWRKRVLVVCLTLGANWVLVTQIAGHPGGGDYVPPPPPEPAPCAPGELQGCLGGLASVVVVPAPAESAASAAAAASAAVDGAADGAASAASAAAGAASAASAASVLPRLT